MKNQLSILFKIRHLLYTLLVVAIFYGCKKADYQVKDYNVRKMENLKEVILTIEIDSCEYIIGHVMDNDTEWVMTHKRNCKHCIEREKKCLFK